MPTESKERLSIEVHESGSSKVVEMFNKIAAEALTAVSAIKKLRKEVGGKGTISEAKKSAGKGKATSRKSIDEINKVRAAERAAQKEFRDGIKRTADLHTQQHKLRVNRIKLKGQLADARVKSENTAAKDTLKKIENEARASKALHAAKRASLKSNWDLSRKIFNDRRAKIIALAKLEAKARKGRITGQGGRVDAKMGTADEAARANRSRIKDLDTTWAKEKRIHTDRRREILATRKTQAVAAESARKYNVGIRNRSIAIQLREEAAAHRKAALATNKHTGALRRLTISTAESSKGMKTLGNQVFFAQRAFAALGGVFLIRGFVGLSDQYQNMQNRIRLVTSSTEELNKVQKKLQQIARSTRQGLSATVETFVRLRLATKKSGISQERLFGVLRTLNQMLTVSGATAIETEQSIRQLSQAFSKGKLDGDEFRSVSEAMPSILTALEESLGKTRGELRAMSEAGQITTEVLVEAFEKSKRKAAEDFGKSISTVGQAWVVLKGEVLKAVGEFNKATGAVGLLVSSLRFLADNLWIVKGILFTLASVIFVMVIRGVKILYAKIALELSVAVVGLGLDIQLRLIPWLVSMGTSMMATASTAGAFRLSLLALMALPVAATVGTIVIALGTFAAAAYATILVTEGLTDAMAGLDEADTFTGNTESALIRLIAKEVELKEALKKRLVVAKRAGFGTNIRDLTKQIKDLDESINVLSHVRDIEENREAVEAHAEAVKDARFEQQQYATAQEKVNNKLKDMLGQVRPVVAAQQAMNKALREFTVLASGTDLSESQILGGREEIRAKFTPQIKPGEEAIKVLEAQVVLAEITNDKQRERAKIENEVLASMIKQRGVFETRKIGAVATIDGLDTSREELFVNAALNDEFETRVKLMLKLAGLTTGAKKKSDTTVSSLQRLLEGLSPILAAKNKLISAEKLLEKAVRRKLLTDKEGLEIAGRVKTSLEDQINPMKALIRLTAQQSKFASLGADARNRQARAEEISLSVFEKKLRFLNDSQRAEIDSILTTQDLNKATEKQVVATEAIIKSLRKKHGLLREGMSLDQAIRAVKEAGLATGDEELEILELTIKKLPKLLDAMKKLKEGTIGQTSEETKLQALRRETLIAVEKAKELRLTGEIPSNRALVEVLREVNFELAEMTTKIRLASEEAQRAAEKKSIAESLFGGIEELFTTEAMFDLTRDTITSMYMSMEDQLVQFVATGKVSFKDMVDSMIQDVARLVARLLVLQAIQAATGTGAGGGAMASVTKISSLVNYRHGGTVDMDKLPRFAGGGSMRVGGQGGPDTKLVQFMASPGESVHVTTPGQSRLDNRQPEPVAPQVNITNVIDPEQFGAALASPPGQRAIVNVIQTNPELFRRFLK